MGKFYWCGSSSLLNLGDGCDVSCCTELAQPKTGRMRLNDKKERATQQAPWDPQSNNPVQRKNESHNNDAPKKDLCVI